jgi:Major Facilitator Superfamily
MLVLLTLASGQFLMTLDSSVMNVSIATVAKDVGTTVTGIQGAITAYTLVMAALMITGAKIGAIIGRKRAFAIGCVIYGCGSFTTSIAQSLPVLLLGWSFLEGVGAALILPAIVALVAGNFPTERRPAAYGLVAAAGAVAVAVGPLIGGFFTTYLSWRLVFTGPDRPRHPRPHAPDRRRTRREAPAARRRRRRALGARARPARLRRAPLRRVGLDPAEGGRPVVGGARPCPRSRPASRSCRSR